MEHNVSVHPLIPRACQYIEEHHQDKITMADLAQYTNYSERSIQLIFQKHFEQFGGCYGIATSSVSVGHWNTQGTN